MRTKSLNLLSGSVDKQVWDLRLAVYENGAFKSKGATFVLRQSTYEKYKNKNQIRKKDRDWVYRNIPSSIHWKTQIHHDWEDGARMYLLTKGKHILIERKRR